MEAPNPIFETPLEQITEKNIINIELLYNKIKYDLNIKKKIVKLSNLL